MPPALPTIRQSALENGRCLARFKALYIDGQREPMSEYADRGIQLHMMHKIYIDHIIATEQECDYEFADSLCERPDFHLEAIRLWRGWYPRQIFNPKTIFGAEVKLTLDENFKSAAVDYAYSGEFDRLEIDRYDATIVDLKSHFACFEPDTIQSVFYAWLLHRTLPHLRKITFVLDFVRWNIVRSREFDVAEIDQLEKDFILPLVQRLRDALDADEWPAIANSKCSICSLECPLIAQGMRPEQIGRFTPESATMLAGQLYAMEQRSTQLHNMLKAYCIERGPIAMDHGMQLGFQKRVNHKFDPSKAVQLNSAYGFDPLRCLKVESAEVKKVEKKYPEYKFELLKTAVDESTTVFDFKTSHGGSSQG